MKTKHIVGMTATAAFLLVLVSSATAAGAANEQQETRGFQAKFSDSGIEVVGIDREGTPWSLGLRMVAWGRGDELIAVPQGAVADNGNRVEITRGSIIEWYVDDGRAVEQGFTLGAPPTAKPAAGAVRLVLATEGGFRCDVLEGARDARFRRRGEGTTVCYTGLRAWDAVGRELAARFTSAEGMLSIHVDDAGAVYPVVVDPWIWTQQAKLAASDAYAHDQFGHAVSLSGDTALVGAYRDSDQGTNSGSAHVFVRSGTTWSQEAMLLASDGAYYDEFGYSVAIDDDIAVVGSDGDDDGGSRAGSAYVFLRTGSSWVEEAKLNANDAVGGDSLGFSIALDDDTVVTGAPGFAGAMGAAYIFVRNGGSWTQEAKLLADDGAAGDRFGESVSISRNTALVGAFQDDSGCGAVYVFKRTGTNWVQQAKLMASDRADDDYFGRAVAVHRDRALIGAEGDDDSGAESGSAYLFERTEGSWIQVEKFIPVDIDPGDLFGCAVAVENNLAIVGADHDDGVGSWNGSAYVYHRSAGAWAGPARISASDEVWGESFGNAVSLSGPYALIGSSLNDDAGVNSGTAFVFLGTIDASATWRNGGTNPNSYTAVTPPILGSLYVATVDVGGTTGHNYAWLVGFATPLTFTLGGGQTLLMNPADPAGELLQQWALLGPLATISIPIPPRLELMGFEACTQAVHLGGVQPYALSNAQDLVVGY